MTDATASIDPMATIDDRQALIEEFNALHPDDALPPDGDFERTACAANRSALCLSGGGIRSAAFAIGALQALARHRLLGTFDYLSTVSGGGFAGAWLQRLIVEQGSVAAAEAELGSPDEPAALRRLRAFTSYLTPQSGPFSADTWTGIVLYLRNTLLNWLGFAPFFAFAVLAAIFYRTALWAAGATTLSALALLAGAACLCRGTFHACILLPSHAGARPAASADIIRRCAIPVLLWAVLAPAAAAAWVQAGPLPWHRGTDAALETLLAHDAPLRWIDPDGAVLAAALGIRARLGAGGRRARPHRRLSGGDVAPAPRRRCLLDAVRPQFPGLAGGDAVLHRLHLPGDGAAVARRHRRAGHAGRAGAGLAGAGERPADRHLRRVSRGFPPARGRSRPRMDGPAERGEAALRPGLGRVHRLLPVADLVPHRPRRRGPCAGLGGGDQHRHRRTGRGLVGKQAFVRFEAAVQPGGKAGGVSLGVLLQLLSVLFAAGLFTLLGAGLGWLLGQVQQALAPLVSGLLAVVLLQAALAGAVVGLGWLQARRLNVNRFSMHAIYRNRLSRAFLGSPRAQRRQDPFTGFDAGDNLPLADLLPPQGGRKLFPVVNMALNLSLDARTEWAERKAASFTATPLRCGSPVLDGRRGSYARTLCYAGNDFPARDVAPGASRGLSMASAMTISGAAVSPNAGYHSSPLTAFLMTLFNVRLGAWLPNPATVTRPRDLDLAMPRQALLAMMGDLFGQTTADSEAVYLSDGGHFDNLGLYEMLRRRCRLIVVIDAGQDGACQFEDLGNALRKAQIDIPGVQVAMGRLHLRARDAADGPAPLGFALGGITYRMAPAEVFEGALLYIKPGWLDDLPADVRAYGLRCPAFPHESTADQWFSESQFESYRALGAWQLGRIAAAATEGDLASLFTAASASAG